MIRTSGSRSRKLRRLRHRVRDRFRRSRGLRRLNRRARSRCSRPDARSHFWQVHQRSLLPLGELALVPCQLGLKLGLLGTLLRQLRAELLCFAGARAVRRLQRTPKLRHLALAFV